MKDMTKFQLVLTGVFAFFIVVGVITFALGGRNKLSSDAGAVLIWGTLPSAQFGDFLQESGIAKDDTLSITYVEKKKETFDADFVEALAALRGPDLFFLAEDSIVKHEDKIVMIPFDSYSERQFKEDFIEEGELYLASKGMLALPFTIDPMVMYWNRDIFSNASLSVPPKNWSEMYDLSARLSKKDSNLNITKSAVALGEYGNITHAFELISLLSMQAGSPIVVREEDDSFDNLFGDSLNFPVAPANRALSFYTEFSNPLKPYYSWNRSLPASKSYFLSGDLALYFGFASEVADLRLKNPNLNFDVAPMLQSKDSQKIITFGKMAGLAIPKSSKNVAGAFKVATLMTSSRAVSELAKITGLPPVRRDLLAVKPKENYQSVFYDGAIQSRAWLSPDISKTSAIFKEMIESVTGGRAMPSEAVGRASVQLNLLFK